MPLIRGRICFFTLFAAVQLLCCSLSLARPASDTLTADSRASLSGLLSVGILPSPAGAFTGEPNFAVSSSGHTALSWIEKSGDGISSLKLSFYRNSVWSTPKTVASGEDWFVNWADFPAIAIDMNDNILASWLVKSASETFAYDVHLALSADDGDSWTESFVAHSDRTNTEHGFVSLESLPAGGFAVTWLDGRETVATNGAMTLRFATVTPEGTLQNEALLDNRTCDCCQTTMTILADGSALVGYRGRSADEVRDIYLVRSDGDSWSSPTLVSHDNWKIRGCPVNGPALASSDSLVVISWFTMGADEKPKVFCAFSRNSGLTFEAPLRLDGGDPLGRVDVVMYDSQTALISWLEQVDESTEIIVRTAMASRTLSSPITVTKSSSSRASGFARMAPTKDGALIAWTNAADTAQVFTALITLQRLR